jgi:hypothetical protein
MKKNILLLCAAVTLAAAGCSFFPTVEGSGFPKTTSYNEAGFTRLSADHAFKVHVIPDTAFSVTVTCDDNIVPYLVVDTTGDAIRVGLLDGYNYRQVILSAEVHMPSLAGMSLSGASEARVDTGFVSQAPLAVNLSGASAIEIAALTCGPLTADVSGASTFSAQTLTAASLSAVVSGGSTMSASGTTAGETLNVSGASTVRLQGLTSSHASVTLSGASKAYVNAGSGQITLSASGVSTLYYAGNPTFVINDLSGGSTILRL